MTGEIEGLTKAVSDSIPLLQFRIEQRPRDGSIS